MSENGSDPSLGGEVARISGTEPALGKEKRHRMTLPEIAKAIKKLELEIEKEKNQRAGAIS